MDANGYQMPPNGAVQCDTPPPGKAQGQGASHQRTYQGSVDNPHDPPCVRCRREAKECYFSATRRKKKRGGADDSALSDSPEPEVYEIKSGRKRLRTSSVPEQELYDEDGFEVPRTPGGSLGRTQPLRRPDVPKPVQYGEDDQKASEQTVGLLQAAEVHGGHDALKLLYEAATVHGGRKTSKESGTRPSLNGVSPASLSSAADTSPMIDKIAGSYNTGPMAMYQHDPMWKAQIHPTSAPIEPILPFEPAGYAAALKAWSRFRFVRAGWFTAKEAIDYIEYFYKHLSPLTPVCLPDYRSYYSHEQLLTREPMLMVTMLLIASRHMNLDGAGAVSRPYSIHQKLWTYLSGMIDRVVWGQEQFGGGFCGAGAEPGCDVNPLTRKGLRTLGTVESLVLLTEWHPRAMHFPPDEADEELMIPDEPVATPGISETNEPKGIGGQRMDAWLEPCWRSDRMCWMLLGISMSLAFEIGVFDASEWLRHALSNDGQPLSAGGLQAYDRRRGNVRDVLLIYVTQTSGRLGLTSMLPSNYTKPEDSPLYKRDLSTHESIQENVLHFWLKISSLMREGNQKIFANKAFTRDLIRNGDYKAALDRLRPPLQQWRLDFDKCASIPRFMRCILEIEYEYCRVYINALALQAVAERCANDRPLLIDPPSELARSAVSTNGVRPDIAISPQTLSKWLGGDRHYLLEVGNAARNLLKVVVDGLYPGQYLRHAPVRTYFRIISTAIMLLKSFSLGASESDVADSLNLMDRTVEALRNCIVDDVHVASRFADLLDTLTQSLKPRLVRIAADGRPGRSRRVSHQGSPEPTQTPLGMANYRLQQTSVGGAMPGQQPWGFDTTMAPNHPLYGISADAYDLMGTDNNFSVMPPPSFGFQSPTATFDQNMNTTPGGAGMDYGNPSNFGADNNAQDWLTLPLDPLINMSGADVNQTMYGPELGGQDMLELLLSGNNANNF
ncbi:zinc finger transcriptional activator [Vermiconidia calcicola]|uniref:Zinc finger transcriptional activator n=1 Tax=Vermiconidia calcicola TaxID=1690605 RepID=A0ACC3MVX1_9PEZI|nr:zinc finger transcriptional activator [Vermiconidia calcicola]